MGKGIKLVDSPAALPISPTSSTESLLSLSPMMSLMSPREARNDDVEIEPVLVTSTNSGNMPNGNGSKGRPHQHNSPPPPNTGFQQDGNECSAMPTPLRASGRAADWDEYLELPHRIGNIQKVADVTLFKHAPLTDIWEKLTLKNSAGDQLTVEVPNACAQPYCSRPLNWWARIVAFAGYKCLIEYESLGLDKHYLAWASFCSEVIQPIGYSTKNLILLYPPFDINTIPDFYRVGYERVVGKPTVAENHAEYIGKEIYNLRKFPIGTQLEVLDMNNVTQMRIATVRAWIGDRIWVKYHGEIPDNDYQGYFFNSNSEFVHPIGWSEAVGHDILQLTKKTPRTASLIEPSSFPPSCPSSSGIKLEVGQHLELLHPIKPHEIVAGRISQLLGHGYFYVLILPEGPVGIRSLKIGLHISSPYIFPCGFCRSHGIQLIPPFGEVMETFSWEKYFSSYNKKPAPLHLLPSRPSPKFEIGMKMEAVDERSPTYLGPATIRDIKGHLLWVHFDGWKSGGEDIAEQWFDFESPNIYPAGFAEMVSHDFQGCVEMD